MLTGDPATGLRKQLRTSGQSTDSYLCLPCLLALALGREGSLGGFASTKVQPVPLFLGPRAAGAVPRPDALARIGREDELCVTDVQQPPQTHVPGSQKPPQTVVPDGQKPPQTPEETKQKEEALGEDKVPTEGDAGE